jgi:hypothetical protein
MKKFVIMLAGLVLISVGANWWLEAQIEKLDNVVQEQAAALEGAFHREQELRRSVVEILKKRRDDGMQDPMLLNGKPRCTLIQRFNGETIVVVPGALEKLYFKNVGEATYEVEGRGWIIGVSHPTIRKEV